MNKLYKNAILLLTCCFFSFTTVNGQALEDVVSSIRSANATSMTRYFDNMVTITVSGNQSAYSKAQAEMVLKDFFSKNIVKEYVVMQTGSTTDNSTKYAIGKLNTSNGVYQLYVLMKLKDTSYFLQEIRIEK